MSIVIGFILSFLTQPEDLTTDYMDFTDNGDNEALPTDVVMIGSGACVQKFLFIRAIRGCPSRFSSAMSVLFFISVD